MTPTQIMNGPAKEVAQYIATAPLNDNYNITYAVINALNRIHALEQQVQELAAAPQLTPEERRAMEAIKAIPTAKVESCATASTAPINKVAFDPNGETPMTDRAEIIFGSSFTRVIEPHICRHIEQLYNWALANWNDCHAELRATKEDLAKAIEKIKQLEKNWASDLKRVDTFRQAANDSRHNEQRLAREVDRLRLNVLNLAAGAGANQDKDAIVQQLHQELAAANKKLMKASTMGIDAHAELSRCRADNQAKCDELARKLGFSEIQLAALREWQEKAMKNGDGWKQAIQAAGFTTEGKDMAECLAEVLAELKATRADKQLLDAAAKKLGQGVQLTMSIDSCNVKLLGEREAAAAGIRADLAPAKIREWLRFATDCKINRATEQRQ